MTSPTWPPNWQPSPSQGSAANDAQAAYDQTLARLNAAVNARMTAEAELASLAADAA